MTSPAAQAHALHAAASLIENTGIPGLSVTVDANSKDEITIREEITIQVPPYLGTPAERTAAVAKLAAAVGGTATRKDSDWQDKFAWVSGAGTTEGHNVAIFTSIPNAGPPGADQDEGESPGNTQAAAEPYEATDDRTPLVFPASREEPPDDTTT